MSDINKLRLMLIEDDRDLSESWQELFDLLGYDLTCHDRATDALGDSHRLAALDILITDYYLPDMNGAELIKSIRAKYPELPVIMLTGSHEPFIREALKDFANLKLFNKPLNISDLEEGIRTLTAVRRRSPSAWASP